MPRPSFLPFLWLPLAAAALFAAPLRAQQCDTSEVDVAANLAKGQLAALPYDVPFNLRLEVPTLSARAGYSTVVESVLLEYGPLMATSAGKRLLETDTVWLRVQGRVRPTELAFLVEPLERDQMYAFRFTVFSRRDSLVQSRDSAVVRSHVLRRPGQDRDEWELSWDTLVSGDSVQKVVVAADTVELRGTPRARFTDRFDADIGVLRSDRLGYWGAMTSSHFYLVPVNRNECTSHYRGSDHLLKRVSIFAGISLFEISSREDVDHLWSTGSPVVGVGVSRLGLPVPLRINAGVIWLRQDDANPLVTRSRTKRDAFISATFDVELQSFITPLAVLAGLK